MVQIGITWNKMLHLFGNAIGILLISFCILAELSITVWAAPNSAHLDPASLCDSVGKGNRGISSTAGRKAIPKRWMEAEEQLGSDVMAYLEQQCDQNDVPVALALGIIKAESNFESDIISPTNDYGLMQINAGPNFEYHQYYQTLLGVHDFLDPYDNIKVGVYLLGENLRQSDENVMWSLMAYHLGRGTAQRRWEEGVRSTSATRKQLAQYYEYLVESPLD